MKKTKKASAKAKTPIEKKAPAKRAVAKKAAAKKAVPKKKKSAAGKKAKGARNLALMAADPNATGRCTFTDSSGHLQCRDGMTKAACAKLLNSTFTPGGSCL
jgi:hypothetical protein